MRILADESQDPETIDARYWDSDMHAMHASRTSFIMAEGFAGGIEATAVNL